MPLWGVAEAGVLTGTTLASNVVSSSLTSVGTLTSLSMGGTLTMGANTLALASATVSGQPTWSSSQTIPGLNVAAAASSSPTARTLQVGDSGSGSNIAGANGTITAGVGTGTGAGGSLLFQVAGAGTSSGSSLNSLTTVLELQATLTVASATGATLNVVDVPALTVTVTGATTTNPSGGFNLVTINGPTLTSSTSVTVDVTSTLAILGTPTNRGSLTIGSQAAALFIQNTLAAAGAVNILMQNTNTGGFSAISYWDSGSTYKFSLGYANSTSGDYNQSKAYIDINAVPFVISLDTTHSHLLMNPPTVASASGAILDIFSMPAQTATITGSTNITTTDGFNWITIYQPTYTASANAVTVTYAATLAIVGAPTTSNSGGYLPVLTNSFALWVEAGASYFGGTLSVVTSQASGAYVLNVENTSTSGYSGISFYNSSAVQEGAIAWGNASATPASQFFIVAYTGALYIDTAVSSGTGGLVMDAATGGAEGAGTINCKGLYLNGTEVFSSTAVLQAVTMGGNLTISTYNIVTDTTTGTKIGTSSSQKLGFWGVTPVVQPASPSGYATVITAGATNAIYRNTTWSGGIGSTAYTIGDIVIALKNVGILAD